MDGNSDRKSRSVDDASREKNWPQSGEDVVVRLPIEDSLDLHTFLPRDIKPLVEEYLFQCQQRQFREVRIIHGRGTGTQRKIVRSLLASNPCVVAYRDAPPESGGWGATTVTLRLREPAQADTVTE